MRRRQLDQLLRAWEAERRELLATIRDQNDRIMLLAGQPWLLPPRDVHPDPVSALEDGDVGLVYDLDQEA